MERKQADLIQQVWSFYKGKKVFLTGHTGFKGSWLCQILLGAGAEITGYSLPPTPEAMLYQASGLDKKINSIYGDIRDYECLKKAIRERKPEIVFHLAAQPLVRESYQNPRETFETNIMGTINLLECIRNQDTIRSFLNVTTDKVYQNKEWEWGYRENERLAGQDPYSNSKSCSELVTHSYKDSFFMEQGVAISTARAGNVIGGGDFARDRIVPDCIRAAVDNQKIIVRNPQSIRPYQHVLEPLFAYLLLAQAQQQEKRKSGSFNVGPEEKNCITTGALVEQFCQSWTEKVGQKADWIGGQEKGPHEANYLKLDCSKMKAVFGWKPKWNITTALEKVIDWQVCFQRRQGISECMDRQIYDYQSAKGK